MYSVPCLGHTKRYKRNKRSHDRKEHGLVAKTVDQFHQVDGLDWGHPNLTEFMNRMQGQGNEGKGKFSIACTYRYDTDRFQTMKSLTLT